MPFVSTIGRLPESHSRALRWAANVIAENLFSKVDSKGRSHTILQEMVDHMSDGHAIQRQDGFTRSKNGRLVPKVTMTGWKLLVQWKDGSTDWIPLKDLKCSNPIELLNSPWAIKFRMSRHSSGGLGRCLAEEIASLLRSKADIGRQVTSLAS